jgi:hypothetical protein
MKLGLVVFGAGSWNWKAAARRLHKEAEESNLFDYYSERWGNTFGVEPKLNEQTEKRGWFYEWYDAGTMMLWLI